MWSLTLTVAFLLSTSVLSTPLINELGQDQEWPTRQSVPQPYNINDNNTEEGIIIGQETTTQFDNDSEISTDDPVKMELTETTPTAIEEVVNTNYTGYQLWKVNLIRIPVLVKVFLGILDKWNEISRWNHNGTHIDILLRPEIQQEISQALENVNASYVVLISNMQKLIDVEKDFSNRNEVDLNQIENSQGHHMTWNQYHSLENIFEYMDYLSKTYPSLVTLKSIGKSFEGRDLKLLKISNGGPTNKAVFINGGIHGREWICPATVTYFIKQFAENFNVESSDIHNIDWYFLPVVNPDGYEYTRHVDRLWRKTRKPNIYSTECVGTDLDHNFGYHWGGYGSTPDMCSLWYRGDEPFSEPETKAISDFITSNEANFSAYVTYQAYGQYILYPWGYDNNEDNYAPDYEQLNGVAKSMARAMEQTGGSRYLVGSIIEYTRAGNPEDWAKSQGIKYAYTIKLGDTGQYAFLLPPSYIENVAKEALAGLRVLAQQLSME